jgi:hypothetical protein
MVRVEWVEAYGRTKGWNARLKSNRRKHRVCEKKFMCNKENNSNLPVRDGFVRSRTWCVARSTCFCPLPLSDDLP